MIINFLFVIRWLSYFVTNVPVYMFYNLSKSVRPFTFDNLLKNDVTSSTFDWDTAEALGHVFIYAIFTELMSFAHAH